MIIEEFLDSYKDLKEYSLKCEYKDTTNSFDGVVYPEVCGEIPDKVKEEVLDKLKQALGRDALGTTMFLRRSPKGVHCPHQVHSDISMGDYSLMLYLTEGEGVGTSLVYHVDSGMGYAPDMEVFTDLLIEDQNEPYAWKTDELVEAKENRAFIFKANRLHRAEPVGGLGEGTEARTVFTCFFS